MNRITDKTKKTLLVSRNHHPEDTIVKIGSCQTGGGFFTVTAGPCSVESEEQIFTAARQVKDAGAAVLRGGAFKPRTSPYDFQGLGAPGLRLLIEAGHAVQLPVASEITSVKNLALFEEVDLLQVGARSMQNYDLLKELGHFGKPVLLKRGFGNTLQELLLSAEYILAGGNSQVILCERGIRTFEASTRSTLDIAAVPVLHEMTHLPVWVDPSHAAGQRRFVGSLSRAAAAAGADGLIIEVHPAPETALSDGPQALLPDEFSQLYQEMQAVRSILGWNKQ